MTLNQLRYLVAIADSGLDITLAAERVHAACWTKQATSARSPPTSAASAKAG